MLSPAQFNKWGPPKPGTDAASQAKVHRAKAARHTADRAKALHLVETYRGDGLSPDVLDAYVASLKAEEHNKRADHLEKLSKIDPTSGGNPHA